MIRWLHRIIFFEIYIVRIMYCIFHYTAQRSRENRIRTIKWLMLCMNNAPFIAALFDIINIPLPSLNHTCCNILHGSRVTMKARQGHLSLHHAFPAGSTHFHHQWSSSEIITNVGLRILNRSLFDAKLQSSKNMKTIQYRSSLSIFFRDVKIHSRIDDSGEFTIVGGGHVVICPTGGGFRGARWNPRDWRGAIRPFSTSAEKLYRVRVARKKKNPPRYYSAFVGYRIVASARSQVARNPRQEGSSYSRLVQASTGRYTPGWFERPVAVGGWNSAGMHPPYKRGRNLTVCSRR